MENQETIAVRMRRLRTAKGLSIKKVAETIAVPPSTYKEWEYGRAIQGEPYEKLAHCFGVSIQELLTGRIATGRLMALSQELRQIQERITFIERELISME